MFVYWALCILLAVQGRDGPGEGGGGGGGDNSRIKCPDVRVWGLKSGPILKDIFCQKILKGSSALFIAIL